MYISHPLIKPNTILRRDYQVEISRRLLERNTLVVLPTGTGKTVIALLFVADLLLRDGGAKVVYVAPTRPLVKQQHDFFLKHLLIGGDRIGLVTGERQPEARRGVWGRQLVFTTPQAFYNDLLRGYVDACGIRAIIFDEAHHAVGNHPYVKIADLLRLSGAIGGIRVVGLTASPGDRAKMEEIMRNLGLEDIVVLTKEDRELRRYLPPVKFILAKADADEALKHALSLLYEAANRRIEALSEAFPEELRGNVRIRSWRDLTYSRLVELRDLVDALYADGTIDQQVRDRVKAVILELVIVDKLISYLESYGYRPFVKYYEEVAGRAAFGRRRAEKSIAADPQINEAYVLVKKLDEKGAVYPKFELVRRIVSGAEGRVIVFVGLRETAHMLRQYLSEHGVACGVLVGQQREGGMSQREQVAELERFRSGAYSVLIATQVGEEGLDISECSMVVFYDNPVSSIRRVQRAGRTGRTLPGKIYFLVNPGTRDEQKFWAGLRKERRTFEELREIAQVLGGHEKAQPLDKFIREEPRPPAPQVKGVVYVDHRERAHKVLRALMEGGYRVEVTTLEVGDYVIGRYLVERKTFADLAESLIGGRLFEQLRSLAGVREYTPVVVIEGDRRDFVGRIGEESLRGVLLSIALDYRIPLFITSGEEETGALLVHLADRALAREERRPQARPGRRPPTLDEIQRFIVAGLPGVDYVLADRLLREFKTVERVFTASAEELMRVKGVGEATARRIREVLTRRYEPSTP